MKISEYIKGNRKGPDARRIEMEAMRDPLLHDALEGFDTVPGDHAEAIRRMQEKVRARSAARPRRRIAVWTAAAAVALLCVAAGGLYTLSREHRGGGLQMADAVELLPENVMVVSPAGEGVRTKERPADVAGIVKQAWEVDTVSTEELRALLGGPAHEIAGDEDIAVLMAADAIAVDSEQAVEIAETAAVEIVEESVMVENISAKGEFADAEVSAVADSAAEAAVAVASRVSERRSQSAAAEKKLDMRGDETVRAQRMAAPQALASRAAAQAATTEEVNAAAHRDVMPAAAQRPTREARKRAELPRMMAAPGIAGIQEVPAARMDSLVALRSFEDYVKNNMAITKDAEGERISGVAVAEFRADSQGHPIDIRILESPDPAASREARRLIRKAPEWPGGRTIRVVVEF